MGLFSSPDGELTVQFYDNPAATNQQTAVSVAYRLPKITPERVARDFVLYTQKVIYCLGPGMPATMLHTVVALPLTTGMYKSMDVLTGDGYSMRMVQPQPGFAKTCHASFYSDRGPVTKFSHGGEDYYAPMSCIAFMQHIIDSLDESTLGRFQQIAGRSIHL